MVLEKQRFKHNKLGLEYLLSSSKNNVPSYARVAFNYGTCELQTQLKIIGLWSQRKYGCHTKGL